MESSKYSRDGVKTFLTCLPERTLNAGIDVETTLTVYDTAYPCTPRDHRHALASRMRGRHGARQDRIGGYKSNPTDEGPPIMAGYAVGEHAPHIRSGFDDLVGHACRFAVNETPVENEPKRRSNDNGER